MFVVHKIVTNNGKDMEVVDNKTVASKRQALEERLRAKYPDNDFTDDESLYGTAVDDLDDYDSKINKYKEVDSKMSEKFMNNPALGGMMVDVLGGKDPIVSVIERYGDDLREYLDDPDKREELAEANKKYMERVSQEKELENEYESNLEESVRVAEEVQTNGGYSDDQVNEAFNQILMDAQNAILGKIDAAMLETKLKGLSHDVDVQEATQEAEVRGKNTKIEEKKKSFKGDQDMPAVLQGKASGATNKTANPTLDALDRAVPNMDVFKGLKRR